MVTHLLVALYKKKTVIEFTDPDAANGNLETATNNIETNNIGNEDVNKNEMTVKNSKNMAKKAAATESSEKVAESFENGKDETDKITTEQEDVHDHAPEGNEVKRTEQPEVDIVVEPAADPVPKAPLVFVPKYKYSEGNRIEKYVFNAKLFYYQRC